MEQINTIDKISAVYRNTAEEARQELNKVQQKIYRIGSLRLLLFVAGVVGIIYFWSESWGILACIALITLLPFLFLMKYHNRLFHRKDYLEKKMEINEQELAALDYDTSSFDDGEAYIDPTHLYTYDLDVFGPHSLFQYINRTCTQPGKHRLAHWLGKHLERKEEIIRRQEAVSELAPELKFRQRFRILGLLYKGKAADETELCQWAESPSIFRSRKLLRLLPVLVTGATSSASHSSWQEFCPQVSTASSGPASSSPASASLAKSPKCRPSMAKNCKFSPPTPPCSTSWKSSLHKPPCSKR